MNGMPIERNGWNSNVCLEINPILIPILCMPQCRVPSNLASLFISSICHQPWYPYIYILSILYAFSSHLKWEIITEGEVTEVYLLIYTPFLPIYSPLPHGGIQNSQGSLQSSMFSLQYFHALFSFVDIYLAEALHLENQGEGECMESKL